MTTRSIVSFLLAITIVTVVYEVVRYRTGRRPSDPAAARHEVTEAEAQAKVAELVWKGMAERDGKGTPWPADVAPEFREHAVERQLTEYVVDRGLGKIERLECVEYPCIAVVELADPSEAGTKALHLALSELVKRSYERTVTVSLQRAPTVDGSGARNRAGISVVPDDERIRNRVRYRALDALSR